MRVSPAKNRIVIIPEIGPEQIGSIVVPDSVRRKSNVGKVVDVSPSLSDIEVGDVVVYNKNAGTQVKFGDEECLVIHRDDIFATLEG